MLIMSHIPGISRYSLQVGRNPQVDSEGKDRNQRSHLGSGFAGFTLIEVMITVAIVAILAAVAVPSYADYVRRSKDQAAFGQLSNYRVKLEQYYQDHRNYGDTTTCAVSAPSAAALTFPATVDSFTYSCTPSSAGQAYTLTATGETETYTLDNTGVQATTRFKGATVTGGCWLVRSATCS